MSSSPSAPQHTINPPTIRVQAFWLTAARVMGVVFTIAIPVVMVRVVNQTDYGIWRQIFMYAGTAVQLAALGVGMSAFYFIPREPERAAQITWNIMLYHLAVGAIPLLTLAVYPGILTDVFHVPAVQPYALLLGVVILLSLFGGFVELLPTALRDVKASTAIIIAIQFTQGLFIIGTALISPKINSLAIAFIVHQISFTAMLLVYAYRRFGKFWKTFEWWFFRRQLGYALSIGTFGILYVLERDIHNYFVAGTFTPAQFAIYAVGCVQVPLVQVFVDSVSTVLAIRLSELQARGAHRDILELLAAAINRVAALQLPIGAALLIMGHDLIMLFYTKAYEASYQVFAVNLIMLFMGVILLDPLFRAYRQLLTTLMIIRAVVVIIMAVSLYLFIQRVGLVGAILIAVAAAAIERVAQLVLAVRTLRINVRDLPLFAPLLQLAILTSAAALSAYAVRNLISPNLLLLRSMAAGVCFSAVYLGGLFTFKLPGSEEFSKDRILGLVTSISAKFKTVAG